MNGVHSQAGSKAYQMSSLEKGAALSSQCKITSPKFPLCKLHPLLEGSLLLRCPNSRESCQDSQTEPLFCEPRFGALRMANCRFEAIRANHSNVMKLGSLCGLRC